MTKRPLLSANLRRAPAGAPNPDPSARGAEVIGIAGRLAARPAAVVPPVSGDSPENAASIVVDAFATATVLSCLAWSQGALLPLRLAAHAWGMAMPRAFADDRPGT